MKETTKRFIEDQIGYRFKNFSLIAQAFVHRSMEKQSPKTNEPLVTVGSMALDFAILRWLTERFGVVRPGRAAFMLEKTGDELSAMKHKLVARGALAERIDWLGLSPFLRMTVVERQSGSVMAAREELFKAIFGAVALDCGWDSQILTEVFETMHEPEGCLNDDNSENYVAIMQKWTREKHRTVPFFYYDRENSVAGYSNIPSVDGEIVYCRGFRDRSWKNAHPFYCLMKLGNTGYFFLGCGRTKGEARTIACRTAYEYLNRRGLWDSIRYPIGAPDEATAVNQLLQLNVLGYISEPVYTYHGTHDVYGTPIWQASCKIGGMNKSFSASAGTKKDAKKKVAFKMLTYLVLNYDNPGKTGAAAPQSNA